MSFDPAVLFRGRAPVRVRDAGRAGAGAFLGILATGLLARLILDGGSLSPLLVPPIGASAVLVFAIPASPLAQPRAVIGGNLLSAIVGVSCALAIPQPALAAAVAVGLAILLMSLLGCLHPPGGAIALGASLAGGGLAAFAATVPLVLVCSLLLVAAAVVFQNLTGHTYPHRAAAAARPHATRDPPPAERVGYTRADLDSALAQYGELLDVSGEDLDALFRQVEIQASQRIHSHIRCGDIMSRDLITVDARQSAERALEFLRSHDLRTAPVIDDRGRVVGMVRRAELLAGGGRSVEQVLDPFVHEVLPTTAIADLLPLLSSGAVHEAMVVAPDRTLVGVITQTDLLAVLYRAHIVEAVVSPGS